MEKKETEKKVKRKTGRPPRAQPLDEVFAIRVPAMQKIRGRLSRLALLLSDETGSVMIASDLARDILLKAISDMEHSLADRIRRGV